MKFPVLKVLQKQLVHALQLTGTSVTPSMAADTAWGCLSVSNRCHWVFIESVVCHR